jgi:hypothetical protein
MSSLIYRYIFEVSRREYMLRQQAPVCLSNCSDVNANEESTISDITQIIRNVDEAYARYKYDNSLFGSNSYHVDMFVTQNICGESMQSIIDHARCFNNLLVEDATGIYPIDIDTHGERYTCLRA